MRNEKDQSCLPAFIVSDGGLQAGAIQGVDLIITGSLYELDKVLLITDKIINVNTAEITAVAEKNIKNLDTVDSAVKEIVAELIIPATGKEKFTYSTETEGYSLMLGLNGVTGTSTSIFSTNPKQGWVLPLALFPEGVNSGVVFPHPGISPMIYWILAMFLKGYWGLRP